MRGEDIMQEHLFAVRRLEDFVPPDHPLRPIRTLVNEALGRLNSLFDTIYAESGHDVIAPEKLVRTLLMQVFHSIRCERQLMEQMQCNLLFRCFIGIAIDDPVWDHSVFSRNRDRLLEHEAIKASFTEILALAERCNLPFKEHFSVDGALIQVWASQMRFKPQDGSDDPAFGFGRNARPDWKGKPRANDTQKSQTNPDARFYRKSRNTAAHPVLPGSYADGEPQRPGRLYFDNASGALLRPAP